MVTLTDLLKQEKLKLKGWFPPDWNHNGLSIEENLNISKKLHKKKASLLSTDEQLILNNEKIIRSCYCTPEAVLKLARFMIGDFNLDPFHNPYSLVKNFAADDFKYLDGNNGDGFKIENWGITTSVWLNPPFNRLSECADLIYNYNLICSAKMAFICHLDYTTYFKRFLQIADYCIILNRIKFIPIPGLEISSPTKSNALFIFNSDKNINTGIIKVDDFDYYCINLKNKEKFIIE